MKTYAEIVEEVVKLEKAKEMLIEGVDDIVILNLTARIDLLKWVLN